MSGATGHFYPRSPCGERRYLINTYHRIFGISIHALLAESDPQLPPQPQKTNRFLSTLSLRRATTLGGFFIACKRFLSTLSLRRATPQPLPLPLFVGYFYPRSPCGERPAHAQADANNHGFLSTLSLRRATAMASIYFHGIFYFYPRSPCGERHPQRCNSPGRC